MTSLVRTAAALALAGAALAGGAREAAAQQRIGAAALVRNEVVQVIGARTTPISLGDDIRRHEVVRTGLDSQAKVVFLDNTNLAIGPGSTVTMDRFVFAGEQTATQVGVNVVRGALRFSSGSSASRAYNLRTPVATIGVRGTVIDIRHIGGQTIVALVEGAAEVCPRGGRARGCVGLDTPGQVAVVTSAGGATRGAPGVWTFAANCSAAGGLCSRQSFASAARVQVAGRNPIAPTLELCGR